MTNDLVSIITPCYNAEKYIADAIESVMNQSYPNWELLITDDCSTDKTVEIIKRYQVLDSRIKLFSTEYNSGHPSLPRNISLKNASGSYFALLDSDDIWFPNKLEEQLIFIKENRYSIITSYVQLINEDGEKLKKIVRTSEEASYNDLLKDMTITSPTVFFSREVADLLYFPQCEQEDYLAWLNVLKKGYKVYNTKSILAYYRVCPNSRSRNKIKMFMRRWHILKYEEKLSLLYALYCMFIYTYKGILKNF